MAEQEKGIIGKKPKNSSSSDIVKMILSASVSAYAEPFTLPLWK